MDTYTVTLEYAYPNGYGSKFYPLAVGIDAVTAERLNTKVDNIIEMFGLHNDYDDSGFFCMKISRTYCTNHEDFEKEPDEEIKEFFNKSFFDLKNLLNV